MPFNGGGGGTLPAHVHNNIPLQGGPLDFANDTISSMNAGSTTYSNGAALQELLLGNPADSLVVNPAGTAPEWAAAGGGGGGWEFVEEFVLGSTQVYFTCNFASAISLADYNVRVDWFLKNDSISSNMEMKINTESGYYIDGGASTGITVSGGVQIPADSWCIGSLQYVGNDIDQERTMGWMKATHGSTGGGETFGVRYEPSFVMNASISSISSIQFFPTNGDQYADNYCRVYKMAVN